MSEEVKELREQLYGHIPPLFENDVGDIGKLKRDVDGVKEDVKAVRKSLKLLEGLPGVGVKVLAAVVVLKQVLDLFGIHLGK